jgi:hypothetical protein
VSGPDDEDKLEAPTVEISNFVITRYWDQIVRIHAQHETAVTVYVTETVQDPETGKCRTVIAFEPIPPEELAEMCVKFAKKDPRVGELMAAPHTHQHVKIVFFHAPTEHTRVLMLPITKGRA